DGALLAGVALEGNDDTKKTRVLKVFDARTGKPVSFVALPGVFSRASNNTVSQRIAGPATPVFSPDGSLLVGPHSTSSDYVGGRQRVNLYFVKSDSGEIVRTLEDPSTSQTRGLDRNDPYRANPRFFSGDGKQLICRVDNVFHTFDVTTGQPLHTLRGHV